VRLHPGIQNQFNILNALIISKILITQRKKNVFYANKILALLIDDSRSLSEIGIDRSFIHMKRYL
jgi:hypothetical protein